jgi:response regulator RpfG family c-di-GMP phosphodiesterase
VQFERILYISYITEDLNIAAMLRAACKRCGAKTVIACRTVSEAIDNIVKKNNQVHLVIEDISIFEQYHFFPIQFLNTCKRFKAPPPCLALCNMNDTFDLKLLKSGHFVDYVTKPLNESFLEQRIRSAYQKSYSYHREGMLAEVVETLINKNEKEKAYSLLLPALAKSPKSIDYIALLSKILFEMKEVSFSELAVRYLIREDKNNSFAKTMLAKILLSTGRVKEANKLEL